MSVAALPTGFEPRRELPNHRLFYSDRGIFGFQGEHVAEAYMRLEPDADGGVGVIWETGLGKTVFSLILAAYLYEDDKIDLVIVVCEPNKVHDWDSAVQRFTALSSLRYHGTGRQKRLAKNGTPHVLITVHETGRNDLMQRVKAAGKRGKGSRADGPLMDALGLRSKRVLWVFDEPKMRNRSSEIYQAYDYVLTQLRRGPNHQRVVGLTATPYEDDTEDAFNLARFLVPKSMPLVGEFEDRYTYGRDPMFGRLVWRKERLPEFAALFQKIILRKRKTDPDVIDQFPKLVEVSVSVPLSKAQRDFYEAVERLLDPPEGEPDTRTEEQIIRDETKLRPALWLTAGHPAAHLHVDNEISTAIVATIGEDGLRAIGSTKTKELIARLRPLVKGQGAQVMMFSFYSSVCVEVARDLRDAGYTVGEYHGRQTEWANRRDEELFKNGELEILMCSDKASRGGNFQNAQYVIEYETANTFAKRTQRAGRNNRIDSDLPSTTLYTVVADDTVEQDAFAKVLDRNKDQDTLLGDKEDDTEFIGADTRKRMLQAYRRRRG